jgi:hypothetical protein
MQPYEMHGVLPPHLPVLGRPSVHIVISYKRKGYPDISHMIDTEDAADTLKQC